MLHASPKPDYPVVSRYPEGFPEGTHWYEVGPGDAPVLVLVHGYMAQAMAWRFVVAELSKHWRVLVLDLPGHGLDRSFKGIEPTIVSLSQWLETIVQELESRHGRVDVVAHSLGALMAGMADFDSGRYVLASPGMRLPRAPGAPEIISRLPPGLNRLVAHQVTLRLFEPLQWEHARMSRDERKTYMEPLKERERIKFLIDLGADLLREPDRLKHLKPKTNLLFLWGEKDPMLPLKDAILLREAYDGAVLHVLEGAGHALMEDYPGPFLEHVLDHLLYTKLTTK